MAGTIPLSLTQQFDVLGKPLSGGQLFFIQAGTVSTPQNAFRDTALTIPLPNPITLDAAGRVPQFFLADGTIKVRLTDKSGVLQLAADGLLVIGPSAGGGGGSPVDPTTILQTGALMPFYGVGIRSGFVRLNGRTIGSASSGATERANADAQALFEYLWNVDPNLVVSTGRGATANGDWVANKQLSLPDGRGSVLSALDDMGNVAAGKYTGVGFISGNGTTLGARLGAVTQPIVQGNLPNVTVPVSTSGNITVTSTRADIGVGGAQAEHVTNIGVNLTPAGSVAITSTGNNSMSGNTSSINGNVVQAPLPTIQPTILATIYIKL